MQQQAQSSAQQQMNAQKDSALAQLLPLLGGLSGAGWSPEALQALIKLPEKEVTVTPAPELPKVEGRRFRGVKKNV